jgi:homoaconitase/3-isopropylmalate dehydratase large subunit
MGTLTEEIFSRKVGRRVRAGEIVVAPVDYAMSHDNTTPLAIESLRKLGKRVWDPDRVIIAFDHMVPAPTPPIYTGRCASSLPSRASPTSSPRASATR